MIGRVKPLPVPGLCTDKTKRGRDHAVLTLSACWSPLLTNLAA